ncbi:MAG: hypothetical protein K2X77_16335 [Candidatus Obscuribacterales bacterium]|jgi:hypothetical protein|nr:hypothetical protein [Candidatus Obscuribacterales bacterium]
MNQTNQSNKNKVNCNAFQKWSSVHPDKLPFPPFELNMALAEGAPVPQGPTRVNLEKWLSQISSVEAIVDEGCKSNQYSDPIDSTGNVDLGLMTNSNMLISNVNNSRILKVKLFLESGKFSQVSEQISRILDVARTGDGGTRVVISYLSGYRTTIKSGLQSVRECLYFLKCPESVLTHLVDLLVGLDHRAVIAKSVTAECNFLLSQSAEPYFLNVQDSQLTEGNPAGKEILQKLLKEHANSRDLNATIGLMRSLTQETANNALLAPGKRSAPKLNELRHELAPLLQALNSGKPINSGEYSVLSSKLGKVQNLIGKVFVLENWEKTFVPIVEAEDRTILQIDATRILVNLNLFERRMHKLPTSINELVQMKYLPELPRERWAGYELKYSPSARTLAFELANGQKFRYEQNKNELAWKIPQPR